jgi:hypothetical protein
MRRFLHTLILIITLGVIPYCAFLTHAASDDRYYPIGTPTLQSVWVDPVAGDDQFSGTSRMMAKRTFTAAWPHPRRQRIYHWLPNSTHAWDV